MYWRHRFHEKIIHTTQTHTSKPLVDIIEDAVSYTISPRGPAELLLKTEHESPPVIIIQAAVHVFYYADMSAIVDHNGTQKPLYDAKGNNTAPCILKVEMTHDHILPVAGMNQDWINDCQIPHLLFKKVYNVQHKTTIKTSEKRLPQLKVGKQSLWSYGATYSMDKSICQVAQRDFMVTPTASDFLIEVVDTPETLTIGELFSQNALIFSIKKNDQILKKYASFYISSINKKIVHIYCKEIENDTSETQ